MGQFLVQARRRGKPFWRTFWRGVPWRVRRTTAARNSPPTGTECCIARCATAHWPLLACSLIGAWLMFTRLTFGTEGAMADSDHLTGSLIITVSVIALAEVARPLRFLNIALGAWLVIAPWLLSGETMVAAAASVVAGIMVIVLSIPRGTIVNCYGGWNRYIV
jgi:hypothetical protein